MKRRTHRTLYAPGADMRTELDFIERPYSSRKLFTATLPIKTREILLESIGETPLKVHIPLINESMDATNPNNAIMVNMHNVVRQAKAMGEKPVNRAEKKETVTGATIAVEDLNDEITKTTEKITNIIDTINADINADIFLPPKTKNSLIWRTGAKLCKTTSRLPKTSLPSKTPPKNIYV